MEKKTIGQFISALRKVNGMTQKQLAEKLNVSDKAVSRWERDESAPDLSLIPVIAEIFNVTSDEILRGERKNQESARKTEPNNTQKQTEYLLTEAKNKLRIRSIISLGVALAGFIAALLCNFGFLRAYIGFMAACVFYLAALVCESVFTVQAFSSVGSEDFLGENLNLCKKQFISIAQKTFSAVILLFAVTLPLAIVPWDTYMGITAVSWLEYGLICLVFGVGVCMAGVWLTNRIALKKQLYSLSAKEIENAQKLKPIKCKYFIILAVALAITFLGQAAFNSIVGATDLVSGITFKNIDNYIEFMETPSENDFENGSVTIYGDSYDSATEEALKGYVYAADGETVVAEYTRRNQSVVAESYEWKDGKLASVTVYTNQDMLRGSTIKEIINGCFFAFYIAEIIVFAISYKSKKRKLY